MPNLRYFNILWCQMHFAVIHGIWQKTIEPQCYNGGGSIDMNIKSCHKNTLYEKARLENDVDIIYDVSCKNDIFYQYPSLLYHKESILDDMKPYTTRESMMINSYVGFSKWFTRLDFHGFNPWLSRKENFPSLGLAQQTHAIRTEVSVPNHSTTWSLCLKLSIWI